MGRAELRGEVEWSCWVAGVGWGGVGWVGGYVETQAPTVTAGITASALQQVTWSWYFCVRPKGLLLLPACGVHAFFVYLASARGRRGRGPLRDNSYVLRHLIGLRQSSGSACIGLFFQGFRQL